jgi:hypothetical protein
MLNVQGDSKSHFSYEMMGLLQMHAVLTVVLGVMLWQLIKDYKRQFRRTERWLHPHPVMILSSLF